MRQNTWGRIQQDLKQFEFEGMWDRVCEKRKRKRERDANKFLYYSLNIYVNMAQSVILGR